MKAFIKTLERGSFAFLSVSPGELTTKGTRLDVNCLETKLRMQAPAQPLLSQRCSCTRRPQTKPDCCHSVWALVLVRKLLSSDSYVTSFMVLGPSLLASLFKGLQ